MPIKADVRYFRKPIEGDICGLWVRLSDGRFFSVGLQDESVESVVNALRHLADFIEHRCNSEETVR